jgi:CRP-like cAMP-binding protein
MMEETSADAEKGAAESLSREQVSAKLREVALFRGLESADLDRILEISDPVLYEKGEVVFEEGERGDHFFIIVQGAIELRKAGGGEPKRLAVLRAGQAFGEMALLNQTPRSASAVAVDRTYMLSVSRPAFRQILGGDSLALRLLKNLSRSLWATSVRLAAKQDERAPPDPPHQALAEFNRLLRARLLPRVTPRVTGYDISASTPPPKHGDGAASWDWFVLADGRPVFAVLRAVRGDIFSAQRLAAVRLLLRGASDERHPTLGALFTTVNRNLRGGWIEGLSGPVACGAVALADGVAEWVGAGDVRAAVLAPRGRREDLPSAPAIGEDADREYESTVFGLGDGHRILTLADGTARSLDVAEEVLNGASRSSARGALMQLTARLASRDAGGNGGHPVTATLIVRTEPAPTAGRPGRNGA